MRKKNLLLLAAFTVLALCAAGCQSSTESTSTAQETATGAQSASSQTDATEVQSSETQTSEATTQSSEATANSSETAGEGASEGALSEDDARKIALDDANVNEADITNILINKEIDDGISIYEVEFYVQNEEYDYDINAATGEILSKDYDIENDFNTQSQSTTDTSSQISQDEAIDIVLDKVSGATEQNVQIKLDTDDGRKVYEGEINYNGKEYEFELNAADGTILEWNEDIAD